MGRRRRRGPPGWLRARDVLQRLLRARGVAPQEDHIGRITCIGSGLSYFTYLATCRLPRDDGAVEETLVVRLPRYDSDKTLGEDAQREARLLAALRSASLPLRIPEPIGLVPADPGLASIQSAVDGVPLEALRLANPWDITARAAAAIHKVDVSVVAGLVRVSYPTRQKHACAVLTVLDAMDLPEAEIAREWALANLPPETPGRLLHGDLLDQNILCSPGQPDEDPGIVDWEYAAVGDPAYDLAVVTRGRRRPFRRPDGAKQLLDAYCAIAQDDVTRSELKLYELCLLAGFYRTECERSGSDSPAAESQAQRFASFVRRL